MFSKESLKSLGHKINYDGVEVDSEQAKIIKTVAIQAARWGMFLQHQTQYSSAWKRTVIGLFKKNFPEESIPEEYLENINNLYNEYYTNKVNFDKTKVFIVDANNEADIVLENTCKIISQLINSY